MTGSDRQGAINSSMATTATPTSTTRGKPTAMMPADRHVSLYLYTSRFRRKISACADSFSARAEVLSASVTGRRRCKRTVKNWLVGEQKVRIISILTALRTRTVPAKCLNRGTCTREPGMGEGIITDYIISEIQVIFHWWCRNCRDGHLKNIFV